jgi:hypothetical protein
MHMTPDERKDLVLELAEILKQTRPDAEFSNDEVRVLKLLIRRQEQSIALRQSIIEKSLTALLVAAVLGLFGMAVAWLASHVYRP